MRRAFHIAVLLVIATAARIPNGHLIGAAAAFVYGIGGIIGCFRFFGRAHKERRARKSTEKANTDRY